MKRLRYIILVFCLALTTLSFAEDKTKAAEAAADNWLKLVDSGNYAQSWDQASSTFKAAVTRQEWVQKLRAVRDPLGALISRKLQSAEYTTQLPGVPDGEYVVIRYDTSFEHKKAAIETVITQIDKDNTWRVSGYFIK